VPSSRRHICGISKKYNLSIVVSCIVLFHCPLLSSDPLPHSRSRIVLLLSSLASTISTSLASSALPPSSCNVLWQRPLATSSCIVSRSCVVFSHCRLALLTISTFLAHHPLSHRLLPSSSPTNLSHHPLPVARILSPWPGSSPTILSRHPLALLSLTLLSLRLSSCAKRLYIFHSTGKEYIPFISVLTSRLPPDSIVPWALLGQQQEVCSLLH
jgi:hypothetical protein